MLRHCSSAAVILALALAEPAVAQDRGFPDFPDTPLQDDALQLVVYDGTQTDLLQRERRQTVAVLLSGVRVEIAAALTAAEVFAGTGISINRTGGTVTVAATGPTTFVGLTDVSATAIVDGQCVAGVAGSLGFQACGGTDTDTHVEIQDGGTSVLINPAFLNFLGNRVLPVTSGTGVDLTIGGPEIYTAGTLLFDDPTVLNFTGAGVAVTRESVTSGQINIAIAGASAGVADGVATAGTYNSTTDAIDFTVATPGSDFSVDVSGVGGSALTVTDGTTSVSSTGTITFTGATVAAVSGTDEATVTIPIGITEAAADTRYVNVTSDTMTSTLTVTPATDAVALFLDARALRSQTPFVFNMNPTGNQQAFWLRRGTDAQAFLTIDGNIGGGNANPGIALGPGGTATRDVTLYRGGADTLTTPNALLAGTLGLETGTLNGQAIAARRIATQTNLGLNDACIVLAVAGTTLTCTQADGGAATVTLPSGGGGVADGYLSDVSVVSSTTTRSATYTLTGAANFNADLPMPWAGAGNQGALDANTRVLIWDEGDNPDSLGYMTTTAFALATDPVLQDEGTVDTDGQIAVLNCVGLAVTCNVIADHTATLTVNVTDASIPASIARDSELPTPDGTGVTTITGASNFSATPGTVHLTGPGVSLAEAGGIVTATILGGGITQVESDATLTGTGVSGDALGVANPPATFAYATGASGFIQDANVPASIARDTEIPILVQGAGILITGSAPQKVIALADTTDDTGVTTITATGSTTTPGTVHFAGNVTVAAAGNTTTVTVLDTGGTGEPAAPTQLAHLTNLGNLDVQGSGVIRTISLSPDLSTILDDDWVEIWFRHGTNSDEVIPEPLQIRAAILKDLASTTGSNETLNNPNEWISVEIGRMAGNNLSYFGHGSLYIGRDQTNLRLAMSLNNQGTSPSIVTITHVPRGGPAGIAGPSGGTGRGITTVTAVGGTATVTYTDATTGTFTLPAGQTGATGAAGPTGPAGAAGSTTFLALTDVTPTSFVDQGRKQVSVNVGGTALVFTNFGETVFQEMNPGSIDAANDRYFIFDESESLPRFLEHDALQLLMADGLGVATITGESTFSETPGTLHLTGSGVSLAEAGGVVTATITGGAVSTALTKAQADDGTDTTEGLVSGLLLYDAITTHAHEFGIPEVGRIPATETDPVLYLTHDYGTGARTDRTITPAALGAVYYGWSTGRNISAGGSVANNDSMGCLTAISGSPVSGTTWSPTRVWSTNRTCLADINQIVINTASHPPSTLTFSNLGLYWREIGSPPTLTDGDDFTFNLRISPFLPATYYFADGTGDMYLAGLYAWEGTPASYVLLSSQDQFTGDIHTITATDTSGMTSAEANGVVTLNLNLSRLSDLTDPFPSAGLLGITTTVGTGQGSVGELGRAITPLLSTITVAKGGTGATTAAQARINLGIPAGFVGSAAAGVGIAWDSTDSEFDLDVFNLAIPIDGEIQGNDRIPFGDADGTGTPSVRILVSELGAFFTDAANSGLTINTAGQFAVDLDDLVRETGDLEGDDLVVVVDSGETGDPSDAVTLQHFGDYYADKATIQAHTTTGVLSVIAVPNDSVDYSDLNIETDALAAFTVNDGLVVENNGNLIRMSSTVLLDSLAGAGLARSGAELRVSISTLDDQGSTRQVDPRTDTMAYDDKGTGTGETTSNDAGTWEVTVTNFLSDAVSSEDFAFGSTGVMELAAAEAFDIHDDVSPAATIADDDRIIFSDEGAAPYPMRYTTAANLAAYVLPANSIGTGQLHTAVLNQTGTATFTMPGGGYAFWPVPTLGPSSGDDEATCMLVTAHGGVGLWHWVEQFSGADCATTSTIRYFTASDKPSVWVELDATGVVIGLWEAEDPISPNDTVAPLRVTHDEDDVPLPGHSIVNVSVPTFPVIERVYSTVLPPAQRPVMLQCVNDYLVGRGWLSAPMASLVDTAVSVPDRYYPSSRQWMMRCAAQAAEVGVSAFYMDELIISGGAWALP